MLWDPLSLILVTYTNISIPKTLRISDHNSCTGLSHALAPQILPKPPQILEIYKGRHRRHYFLNFTSNKIHFTRYIGGWSSISAPYLAISSF